jgi:ubiquinone/menaquinone biosynthesis C-methylase UbiE
MTMNGGAYVFNTVSKLKLLAPFFVEDTVSTEKIASEKGLNSKTLEEIYDVLCALDLLVKEEQGYKLAPVFMMMKDNYQTLSSQYWEHLPTFILENIPFRKMDDVNESEEIYQNEVRSLGHMMEPSAQYLTKLFPQKYKSIIDIGAGSGIWSSYFLAKDNEAKGYMVDWPGVLKVAKERIAKNNLEERVSLIEGNYHLVDFSKNNDLAILGNVAHLESDDDLKTLINKTRDCLNDEGTILIVDCFGNKKEGELARSLYKLGLSLRTVNGRVPKIKDLTKMLVESDFKDVKHHSIDVIPHTMGVLSAKKKSI